MSPDGVSGPVQPTSPVTVAGLSRRAWRAGLLLLVGVVVAVGGGFAGAWGVQEWGRDSALLKLPTAALVLGFVAAVFGAVGLISGVIIARIVRGDSWAPMADVRDAIVGYGNGQAVLVSYRRGGSPDWEVFKVMSPVRRRRLDEMRQALADGGRVAGTEGRFRVFADADGEHLWLGYRPNPKSARRDVPDLHRT